MNLRKVKGRVELSSLQIDRLSSELLSASLPESFGHPAHSKAHSIRQVRACQESNTVQGFRGLVSLFALLHASAGLAEMLHSSSNEIH